jgi:hypothetical protein
VLLSCLPADGRVDDLNDPVAPEAVPQDLRVGRVSFEGDDSPLPVDEASERLGDVPDVGSDVRATPAT